MNAVEIPLFADNQSFSTTLNGSIYQFIVIWRDPLWFIDISDNSGNLLIGGLPLVTGVNLLEQHAFMGLEFSLKVLCDDPSQDYPTVNNLGIGSHLYVITE